MEEKMKDKKLDLNKVESMWFWENDHRKSNRIHVRPKEPKALEGEFDYTIEKNTDLTKMIREQGARFYTCDDDYEDGDDYRYGYFWPAKEIDHTPVDQMEGDGHVHMFVREEGKYKQL